MSDELTVALLPFAKAAEDYEPPTSKLYRDEEHVALSLTAGDLRRARRALLRHQNRTFKQSQAKEQSS